MKPPSGVERNLSKHEVFIRKSLTKPYQKLLALRIKYWERLSRP